MLVIKELPVFSFSLAEFDQKVQRMFLICLKQVLSKSFQNQSTHFCQIMGDLDGKVWEGCSCS